MSRAKGVPRRRELMGEMPAELLLQHGDGS